ncbi:MAG TPA: universal stress protein UspA, partial [Halieaceae bacterium]|nr:universal stress protein UspA [Halieaceae bacterium]
GRPETEIPAVARQIGADLIVLGSHGRWGLELLLGTTTDGVVSAADCDVLAIRVDRET